MALVKRVKEGGCYYKGYTLTVLATTGSYAIFMSISSGGCAINSLAVIPDKAGVGDSFTLEHVSGTTGSSVIATLGETIPNMGANVPINLDFMAMEKISVGNSLKLTYANVAATSLTANIIVERGR
jgi:hypothetical protein